MNKLEASKILGIPIDTEDTHIIKNAFKKIAMVTHPDKVSGHEEEFKKAGLTRSMTKALELCGLLLKT